MEESKKKEIVRILLTDSLPSDKSFGGLRNNNKKKVKRPTGTANGTNIERYHLYKDVFGHLSYAMKNGFYIEAIALLESAISDRLESVANVISNGTDYSYKTIGQLVNYLGGIHQENALIKYFSYHRNCHALYTEFKESLKKIWKWKDSRNNALHGMCKLYSGNKDNFITRYADLEKVAKEGIELFREISNIIKKAQNAYNKQQKSVSNQQVI